MNNNPVSQANSKPDTIPNLNNSESILKPQQVRDFLSQTIIQFLAPISVSSTSHASKISPQFIQAVQDLVQIVAHLRSPNGAWPSNIPQTPENLIPYVSEEVYHVLETYKQQVSHPEMISATPTDSTLYIPAFILVQDLIPKLLWNLAQSSYELMRLLTGIPVEVLLPGHDWTSGKLRLVANLVFQTNSHTLAIDLATNTILTDFLSRDAYLQSNNCYLCQHPVQAQSILNQIKTQIQDKIQDDGIWMQSNSTQILEPKKPWQPSKISLNFELEFIPEFKPPQINILETPLESYYLEEDLFSNASDIQNVEYSVLASVSTPSLLETQIRLTDPKIIQPYTQTQIQQYWWRWLTQKTDQKPPIPSTEPLSNSDSLTENSLLIDFIQIADELVDVIYNPTSISSLAKLQPELSLVELSLRLLWQIISSSYTLMQLISGIKAKLLQPGCQWETGTLRLLAVLNADFLNETWELDIATSQTLKLDVQIPAPESIIQSDSCEWCQLPQSIEFLIRQATNRLETLPELTSWMKGAKLDWGYPNQNIELPITWQTGFAQLSIGFEWIKDVQQPDH